MAVNLDVPTLILLAAIACWASGVAAWRMMESRQDRLLRDWAVAMFLEGLAFVLFLLRGTAPDWLSIVVANVLLSSSYALIGLSIARYQQISLSPWLLRGPPLLILLVFPFILDQQGTRNLLAATIEGAQILLALLLLLSRRAAPSGLGYRLLSLGLALSLAIFVLRIGAAVWAGDPAPNVTAQHPLQVITFVVGLIGLLLCGVGFLFMVRDDAHSRRPASADFSPQSATERRHTAPWLLLMLALALLGGQMGYDLWQTRQRIEHLVQAQLVNYSLILSEELERRVRSVDVALNSLRKVVPTQLNHQDGKKIVQQQLQSLTQALDGVRTLLVLDANGNALASNRPELVGLNFAHRDYFQTMQQNPQIDRLHVSEPFTTLLGVYSVILVRTIHGPSGEFAGIVTATFDQDSLRDLMLSLHAGEQTRLSVLSDSGTLIKLVPETAQVPPGSKVDKPGTFYSRHRQSGQPASLMTGISGATGTASFMSMRTLQLADLGMDHGLIVAVARDQAAVLADWQAMVGARIAVFLLVATLAALLLAVYLLRRRQIEGELQQQDEARQRLTNTLQRFIDHLPGTAFVKDANAVTLMANRGFQTLLGMDPATMIGKTTGELFPGAFGEKILADDRQVLETGVTRVIEEHFNGRDYESTKFVIDTGTGEKQLGGMTLDITPRKQVERERDAQLQQLRELNEKLEAAQSQLLQSEKMASLGQLAAGVAHELNNPIGFVHSNLGTLESYLKDIFEIATACEQAACQASNSADFAAITELKQKKDFEFIRTDIFNLMAESQEGLARVKRIVQDLKDFSRPGETNWQWTDLHQGLDSTLNIVWNELKYKCAVKKEYGNLPNVRCLLSQLNQVFMNLLANAGQAIAEQGTITIRTGQRGEEVFVAIADTGCGIAPQHLNRLFEPFFTTKPVGKGTGLGLSLAYGIVQKHQGRIEVHSEVGKGSTFTVWLPVNGPEEA